MTKQKINVLIALMEEITTEIALFSNLISERDTTIIQAGLSVLTKEERAHINSAENAADLAREFLERL